MTLRRSSRTAVLSKGRGINPAAAGQNVIMHRLGLVRRDEAPDTTSFKEYIRLFAFGLSDAHCLAIRELFGHMVNTSGQACALEDEDFMEAAKELFQDEFASAAARQA